MLGDDFDSGCHGTVDLFFFKNGATFQLSSLCQDLLTATEVHFIRRHIPDSHVRSVASGLIQFPMSDGPKGIRTRV